MAEAAQKHGIKSSNVFDDHAYTYAIDLISWAWDYYAMTQHLIVNPRAIQAQSVNDVDLRWWNDMQAFKRHEKHFEEQ